MAILFNVGCKLNQYEGSCLFEKFRTDDNVIIVNTCCVTHEAEVKSLKKFRQAKRNFPGKKIIITGCLVQLRPELFVDCEKIDNEERNRINEEIFPTPKKSRYFLKIEDGCNQPCTFCVVSKLRQKIISKPADIIKKEIEWARNLGFNEIVLVGANIGLYGIDIDSSLIEIFKELSKIKMLPRIRLSSLEPNFITAEFISCIKDLPFCRHFHIPVQSGDDRILSLMGRRYDSNYLKNIFELITKNFSDVAIGGDVIVGFPEEKETEFKNTYDLIQDSPMTHLHIFTYSPRHITEAYKLGDPVSNLEKKERFWMLKKLISEKNYRFRQQLVGKEIFAIIEKKRGMVKGLTDNYIRINIDQPCQEKELHAIKLTKVTETETFGTVVR
uniref:MiaB/RimO family radical SAM methylthiotransferase n=1 Tax=candidate division WOR-3 bacterium TaxID=2052148 RepID=A0A7V1EH36_UNCW3